MTPKRPIYRQKALDHYRAAREQIVWPRFASVRWSVVVWALAAVLLAGLMAVITARVPLYAEGVAIVLPAQNGMAARIGIFLPPKDATQVAVGQVATVHFNGQPDVILQPVIAINTSVLSPSEARQRFALDPASALAVNTPSVVAFVAANEPAAHMQGAVGRAEVQIGTQRAIELVAGALFR